MQELISPEQSEKLILVAWLLLTLAGAGWGWRTVGTRGLIAALPGLLIYPLWQVHKWITRYDPQTGYFGLQSVKVLLVELVVFVVLGAALGWMWKALVRKG